MSFQLHRKPPALHDAPADSPLHPHSLSLGFHYTFLIQCLKKSSQDDSSASCQSPSLDSSLHQRCRPVGFTFLKAMSMEAHSLLKDHRLSRADSSNPLPTQLQCKPLLLPPAASARCAPSALPAFSHLILQQPMVAVFPLKDEEPGVEQLSDLSAITHPGRWWRQTWTSVSYFLSQSDFPLPVALPAPARPCLCLCRS